MVVSVHCMLAISSFVIFQVVKLKHSPLVPLDFTTKEDIIRDAQPKMMIDHGVQQMCRPTEKCNRPWNILTVWMDAQLTMVNLSLQNDTKQDFFSFLLCLCVG